MRVGEISRPENSRRIRELIRGDWESRRGDLHRLALEIDADSALELVDAWRATERATAREVERDRARQRGRLRAQSRPSLPEEYVRDEAEWTFAGDAELVDLTVTAWRDALPVARAEWRAQAEAFGAFLAGGRGVDESLARDRAIERFDDAELAELAVAAFCQTRSELQQEAS